MEKQGVIVTKNDSLATATVDLKKGDIAKMFLGDEIIEVVMKKMLNSVTNLLSKILKKESML